MLVLPLLQRFYKKCASYHLPEDCTKREEYCCVKDERLSNYFHEIFFRLLLLFFCHVWHLKSNWKLSNHVECLYLCLAWSFVSRWLVTHGLRWHIVWVFITGDIVLGALCRYIVVHIVGRLCASNTHSQCTHWVFITRRRKTDRWQRKESNTCMFKQTLFPFHPFLDVLQVRSVLVIPTAHNVPTGHLLQGIAASVLISLGCQQSLPRPFLYSTWARRTDDMDFKQEEHRIFSKAQFVCICIKS